MLTIKRAYEPAAASDGIRILVDRLWPRGVSKERAALHEWLKDLGPSDELRKWFRHEPDRGVEFKKRYVKELSAPEKQEQLRRIADLASRGKVTLVFAASDTEHNNARVLEELITELQKEPGLRR